MVNNGMALIAEDDHIFRAGQSLPPILCRVIGMMKDQATLGLLAALARMIRGLNHLPSQLFPFRVAVPSALSALPVRAIRPARGKRAINFASALQRTEASLTGCAFVAVLLASLGNLKRLPTLFAGHSSAFDANGVRVVDDSLHIAGAIATGIIRHHARQLGSEPARTLSRTKSRIAGGHGAEGTRNHHKAIIAGARRYA